MDTNIKEGGAGPIIATIIILGVVVLGGLYFWGQRNPTANNDIYGNTLNTTAESAVDTTSIDTQSTSNNPASINADLNSTNIDNLGAEINAS